MRPLKRVVATAFCLMATLAQAAGIRLLDIPADHDGRTLTGAVWYPCAQPPGSVKRGFVVMSVAKDCPIAGENLPLVVISHGWSGSFIGHRDIAEALADAGFVVAAIDHGDSATNERRNGDFSVLIERPTDVRRVIDFMLGPWSDASRIDAARVGFFGFSRGGYTGLVAIGADPVFGKAPKACEGRNSLICEQIRRGELPALPHDPRIKAAVIADPLSLFFTAGSMRNVKVPVQLWSSAHGGDGVTPESVAAIARALPAGVEFHVVPNSQHFGFLPPCPAELAKRAPEICSDPPGFDREAFHKQLDADVLAFFRKNLAVP
ncbi:dienelactone hydrolase [Burkholderia ubonensis]|uniref:alpha/beta hydrolase family protein n=1 Tax=Burkholderia ubonensis TaxID=101571 RepID=UPI0008417435|nr:dienelactone hydrolase [Burkholderia ubonensis]AOK61249.1 dienelactone hydrolase [Burkholderia ubonensis]